MYYQVPRQGYSALQAMLLAENSYVILCLAGFLFMSDSLCNWRHMEIEWGYEYRITSKYNSEVGRSCNLPMCMRPKEITEFIPNKREVIGGEQWRCWNGAGLTGRLKFCFLFFKPS